jgi:hypothetical protein
MVQPLRSPALVLDAVSVAIEEDAWRLLELDDEYYLANPEDEPELADPESEPELDVSYFLANAEDDAGAEVIMVSQEEFVSDGEYTEPFILVEFGGRSFAIHGSLQLGQVTLEDMEEEGDDLCQLTVDLCQPAGRDRFGEWLAGQGLVLGEAQLAELADRLHRLTEAS